MSLNLDISNLHTPEDWQQFEASLLTVGLFEKLPVSVPEASEDDIKMILLWRSVITQALFDILRGPTVDCSSVWLSLEDLAKSGIREHNLKQSQQIYRDAIHWVYGGRTVLEWVDDLNKLSERDTDFVQVCDLAHIEPGLVRTTFVKLVDLKRERLALWASIKKET